MRVIRVTTGQINWSSSKPRTFFICIKYRRTASCVHSINVLKLEETRATVPKIFLHKFGRHICWHLIAFYRARRSCKFIKARAIARFRNQFARGQKTIGSHLKLNFDIKYLRCLGFSNISVCKTPWSVPMGSNRWYLISITLECPIEWPTNPIKSIQTS